MDRGRQRHAVRSNDLRRDEIAPLTAHSPGWRFSNGHIGDDLVRSPWLAQRSAAHDFSAGCGCDLRDERRLAGHQGLGIGGYHPAVSVRIARTTRWYVVRYEALWPPRRNCIPKSGVGSPIGVGRGADFLTGATSPRGPSAGEPQFSVAALPWCSLPPVSPQKGPRSPRSDRHR